MAQMNTDFHRLWCAVPMLNSLNNTMLQAILFDLDDTLLGNNIESFLPDYFDTLSRYASEVMEKKAFLRELLLGTRAMIESEEPGLTNREVFWTTFCGRTGLQQSDLEPYFQRFYREEFGKLRPLTHSLPEAVALARYCFDQGLQVVVATNPLFPLDAIEQRLAWAGLPVTDYPFALVTAYENMHTTKPNPAYYREILATIGCRLPGQALMVGNEWDNDIAPAAAAGLLTYWVCQPGQAPPDPSLPLAGSGSLAALHCRLVEGRLHT
jgi:FMN phosphatase YigB (HAD superfamily)